MFPLGKKREVGLTDTAEEQWQPTGRRSLCSPGALHAQNSPLTVRLTCLASLGSGVESPLERRLESPHTVWPCSSRATLASAASWVQAGPLPLRSLDSEQPLPKSYVLGYKDECDAHLHLGRRARATIRCPECWSKVRTWERWTENLLPRDPETVTEGNVPWSERTEKDPNIPPGKASQGNS